MKRHECEDWEWESRVIDGIRVGGRVHYVGWYTSGDSFGYGCTPPDGESRIVGVEDMEAYNEETGEDVEITEELTKKFMEAIS